MDTNTEIAKTARAAKVGQKYTCSRCQGKGYGTWKVAIAGVPGTCLKCLGKGYCVKEDANEVKIKVVYLALNSYNMVESIHLHEMDKPDATLWLGASFEWTYKGRTEVLKVVAKKMEKATAKRVIEVKKSKDFDYLAAHRNALRNK